MTIKKEGAPKCDSPARKGGGKCFALTSRCVNPIALKGARGIKPRKRLTRCAVELMCELPSLDDRGRCEMPGVTKRISEKGFRRRGPGHGPSPDQAFARQPLFLPGGPAWVRLSPKPFPGLPAAGAGAGAPGASAGAPGGSAAGPPGTPAPSLAGGEGAFS